MLSCPIELDGDCMPTDMMVDDDDDMRRVRPLWVLADGEETTRGEVCPPLGLDGIACTTVPTRPRPTGSGGRRDGVPCTRPWRGGSDMVGTAPPTTTPAPPPLPPPRLDIPGLWPP